MTIYPAAQSPVYVALDDGDLDRAIMLARRVAPFVGGFKLGLEFFMAQGPDGVRRVAAATDAPIFLDVKLHDIPNTVGGAMRALADLHPAIINVHAEGGRAMMRAARDAMPPETRVIAVTVLTSLDDDDLAASGVAGGTARAVQQRLSLARDAGLDGLVCSGQDVRACRAAWPDALLVTPGLRLPDDARGDQKRVVTPQDAQAAGADILVIGRTITADPDPSRAAERVARHLHQS